MLNIKMICVCLLEIFVIQANIYNKLIFKANLLCEQDDDYLQYINTLHSSNYIFDKYTNYAFIKINTLTVGGH